MPISKRLLDVIVSLSALVLFLPFGLIIAVILKFTGEKEIFYFQLRVGKNGKLFQLIKFATMVKNSENLRSAIITIKNDPRVLPFGRFLRKTKLNEVPQFLNVLKGDMSIVGPRPMMPQEVGFYPPEIQEQILKIRPGLTGVGSVIFRDEESIMDASSKPTMDCYKEDILPYKGQVELWYIKNQSISLDLMLIFLTAVVVIVPRSMLYKRLLKDFR